MIAITPSRGIGPAAIYLDKLTTSGKTRTEAIRCLKRYLAREIYQIITSPPKAEPSAA